MSLGGAPWVREEKRRACVATRGGHVMIASLMFTEGMKAVTGAAAAYCSSVELGRAAVHAWRGRSSKSVLQGQRA